MTAQLHKWYAVLFALLIPLAGAAPAIATGISNQSTNVHISNQLVEEDNASNPFHNNSTTHGFNITSETTASTQLGLQSVASGTPPSGPTAYEIRIQARDKLAAADQSAKDKIEDTLGFFGSQRNRIHHDYKSAIQLFEEDISILKELGYSRNDVLAHSNANDGYILHNRSYYLVHEEINPKSGIAQKKPAQNLLDSQIILVNTALRDARLALEGRYSELSQLETIHNNIYAAQESLAQGNESYTFGNYIKATEHYKRAWNQVQRAIDILREQTGPQLTINDTADPPQAQSTHTNIEFTVSALRPSQLELVGVLTNGKKGPGIMLGGISGQKLKYKTFNTDAPVPTPITRVTLKVFSHPQNLSTKSPRRPSRERQTDSVFYYDGDKLPDRFEREVSKTDPKNNDSNSAANAHNDAGDGIIDGNEDFDGDGTVAVQENQQGTEIWVVDTDGDGLPDDWETQYENLDPEDPDVNHNNQPDGTDDFDNDGLSNRQELDAKTNPFVADTDADGLTDRLELELGIDPTTEDSDGDGNLDTATDYDGDGLTAAQELDLDTDVQDTDSDSDRLPDGWEARYDGLSPTNSDSNGDGTADDDADLDADGLLTFTEYEEGTAPFDWDTDGDNLSDSLEVKIPGADPTKSDSNGDNASDQYHDYDGDGVPAVLELRYNTSLNKTDTDGDGLLDFVELQYLGLNATRADSNGDGVPDGAADPDGDSLNTSTEIQRGINPFNNDTDGDSLSDDTELELNTDPNKLDTDDDGLRDPEEQELRARGKDVTPTKTDTDGDGTKDGNEIYNTTTTQHGITVTLAGHENLAEHVTIDPTTNGTNGSRITDIFHLESSKDFYFARISIPESTLANTTDLGNASIYKWDADSDDRWQQIQTTVSSSGSGSVGSNALDGSSSATLTGNVTSFSHVTVAYGRDRLSGGTGGGTPSLQLDLGWPNFDSLNSLSDWETKGSTGSDSGSAILRSYWDDSLSGSDDPEDPDDPEDNESSGGGGDTEPEGPVDSDGDGIPDSWEETHGTDPKDADTDGDGWSDYREIVTEGSDPNVPDTDGDTLDDGNENGGDPLLTNTDCDDFSDPHEPASIRNDPSREPGDDDSQIGKMVSQFYKTACEKDPDGDGLSNHVENALGTGITDVDSDNDGLDDDEERGFALTSDRDNDGCPDGNDDNPFYWNLSDCTPDIPANPGVRALADLTASSSNGSVTSYIERPLNLPDQSDHYDITVTLEASADTTANDTSWVDFSVDNSYYEHTTRNTSTGFGMQEIEKTVTVAPGEDFSLNVTTHGNASAEITTVTVTQDTDGDGIRDLVEEHSDEIDIGLARAKGDGDAEFETVDLALDSTRADTDGDGLSDSEEISFTTDRNPSGVLSVWLDETTAHPALTDSDGDGVDDARELAAVEYQFATQSAAPHVKNATKNGTNVGQYLTTKTSATDPLRFDTDGDGWGDARERRVTHTNADSLDTDGDGQNDPVDREPTLHDYRAPKVTFQSIDAHAVRDVEIEEGDVYDARYSITYNLTDPSGVASAQPIKNGQPKSERTFDGVRQTQIIEQEFRADRSSTYAFEALTLGFQVKLQAADVHENSRTKVHRSPSSVSTFTGYLRNSPVMGDEAFNAGAAFAGLTYATGQSADDLINLAKNPSQLLGLVDLAKALVAKPGLIAEIPGAMVGSVQEAQRSQNTYAGEDGVDFRNFWYGGYVSGMFLTSVVGDKGTSAIVSKASSFSSRIAKTVKLLQKAKLTAKGKTIGPVKRGAVHVAKRTGGTVAGVGSKTLVAPLSRLSTVAQIRAKRTLNSRLSTAKDWFADSPGDGGVHEYAAEWKGLTRFTSRHGASGVQLIESLEKENARKFLKKIDTGCGPSRITGGGSLGVVISADERGSNRVFALRDPIFKNVICNTLTYDLDDDTVSNANAHLTNLQEYHHELQNVVGGLGTQGVVLLGKLDATEAKALGRFVRTDSGELDVDRISFLRQLTSSNQDSAQMLFKIDSIEQVEFSEWDAWRDKIGGDFSPSQANEYLVELQEIRTKAGNGDIMYERHYFEKLVGSGDGDVDHRGINEYIGEVKGGNKMVEEGKVDQANYEPLMDPNRKKGEGDPDYEAKINGELVPIEVKTRKITFRGVSDKVQDLSDWTKDYINIDNKVGAWESDVGVSKDGILLARLRGISIEESKIAKEAVEMYYNTPNLEKPDKLDEIWYEVDDGYIIVDVDDSGVVSVTTESYTVAGSKYTTGNMVARQRSVA